MSASNDHSYFPSRCPPTCHSHSSRPPDDQAQMVGIPQPLAHLLSEQRHQVRQRGLQACSTQRRQQQRRQCRGSSAGPGTGSLMRGGWKMLYAECVGRASWREYMHPETLTAPTWVSGQAGSHSAASQRRAALQGAPHYVEIELQLIGHGVPEGKACQDTTTSSSSAASLPATLRLLAGALYHSCPRGLAMQRFPGCRCPACGRHGHTPRLRVFSSRRLHAAHRQPVGRDAHLERRGWEWRLGGLRAPRCRGRS